MLLKHPLFNWSIQILSNHIVQQCLTFHKIILIYGTKKNYIKSKIKIFKNQTKSDIAYLNDINLKNLQKKNKFQRKIKIYKKKCFKLEKHQNRYLQLEANKDNVLFAYFITKLFQINKKKFLKSLTTFSGLPHRHEIFLKLGKSIFINDSKQPL